MWKSFARSIYKQDAYSASHRKLFSTCEGKDREAEFIFIRGLEVEAILGVYPEERVAPQKILIDLEMGLPSALPCDTDDIADAVDYAYVVDCVRQVACEGKFFLLEALSQRIAETLINLLRAKWVDVRVSKPGVLPGVEQVGIAIRRLGLPSVVL